MLRIEVDEELAARLIRASREFHRLASARFNVSDIKAVVSFEEMIAGLKGNACKE